MSQITTGLRAILNHPKIYDFFQNLMGARAGRQEWIHEYVRPIPGCRVLDIGCGTARILDYLPNVKYYGFDLSQKYIDDATRRYGMRGVFHCGLVEQTVIDHLEPFDIVLAAGLLHHLDDEQSIALHRLAWSALRKGGKLVTIDPCYADNQNAASRFFVSRDRGKNVRDSASYSSLAKTVFSNTVTFVRHRKWVPYTHCIMVSIK